MRSVLLGVLVLALAACGKKDEPPDEGGRPGTGDQVAPGAGPTATSGGSGTTPTAGAGAAAFEARNVFQTICATCHGPGGRGDGQAAQMLNPKPRNYTDKTWQASVTDDEIKKIILLGGQAVGKSAVMPAQPQLADKPEVVAELVKIVRSFGQ